MIPKRKEVDPVEILVAILSLTSAEQDHVRKQIQDVMDDEYAKPVSDMEFIAFGIALSLTTLAGLSGDIITQQVEKPDIIRGMFGPSSKWTRIVTD